MSRPPSGRGRAVTSAPCATAMASPRPCPCPCPSSSRCRTRSSPSRWKGWNRRLSSPGGITGPVLVTRTTARPAGGERVGHLVPHPFKQFLGRDHPAVGGQQALEHREFLRAEVEPTPAPLRHLAARIEAQIARRQHRRRGRGGPPRQRPDPRDQLGEVERLGPESRNPRRPALSCFQHGRPPGVSPVSSSPRSASPSQPPALVTAAPCGHQVHRGVTAGRPRRGPRGTPAP